jgi:hypothetical protein
LEIDGKANFGRVEKLADYLLPRSLFENSGSGPITSRKVSQKRSVYVICEHFGTLFKAVSGSQTEFSNRLQNNLDSRKSICNRVRIYQNGIPPTFQREKRKDIATDHCNNG